MSVRTGAVCLALLLALDGCGRSHVQKKPDAIPYTPDPHRAGDGSPAAADNAVADNTVD